MSIIFIFCGGKYGDHKESWEQKRGSLVTNTCALVISSFTHFILLRIELTPCGKLFI